MIGACEICGRIKPLDADHDHNTGVIRGFLCRNCNMTLGRFGDDVPGIERVLVYLRSGTTGVTYREYLRVYEREKSSHRYAHRVLTNTDYKARRAEYARSHRQRTKTNGSSISAWRVR